MEERAKEEVLLNEGNAYFDRNLVGGGSHDIKPSTGCMLFDDFLNQNVWLHQLPGQKILEIGCCYGYNLIYLCRKYGFEGFGIEPSGKAVAYGKKLVQSQAGCNVFLSQGTSDVLDFEDNYFDIVVFGFCVFWVDRKWVMKSVSEADRVLKTGGVIALWDFDTKIPYRRPNRHNVSVPTYKQDLSGYFLGNPQYSLIEKRPFSHAGVGFCPQIQERCALNVLFKERIEDAYVYCG